MKKLHKNFLEMRVFLLLWLSQSFSGLGSAMTAYALVIWSYNQKGSALVTALLMVCSYAPYVACSIFAGALSDRWNKKKTMLICDSIAAVTTLFVFVLIKQDSLQIWHLYLINAISGLMNTFQQPASEVAITRVLPRQYYQKVGGLKYLSGSVTSILTPVITMAVMGFWGIGAVMTFDFFTFLIAFVTLLFFIKIPEEKSVQEQGESFMEAVKGGLVFLKQQKGVFDLILFLAAINFVASIYNAAFPAMMLSREGGGERAMALVNTVIGITTLVGSILASFMKEPKSRIRVICNCLLFSMSTENFLLAFGRNEVVWCIAGFLGWIAIPLMNANMDAILRLRIPIEMQGRIYSIRNSLQFFTIPVGYFLGGFLVDYMFEPIMAMQKTDSILLHLFGRGKGSGAAFLFFVIAFAGIFVCLYFRRDKHLWELEK